MQTKGKSLRYLCPGCGTDLGEFQTDKSPPAEVTCPSCGAVAALGLPGGAAAKAGVPRAIKVVSTGSAATVRHV